MDMTILFAHKCHMSFFCTYAKEQKLNLTLAAQRGVGVTTVWAAPKRKGSLPSSF